MAPSAASLGDDSYNLPADEAADVPGTEECYRGVQKGMQKKPQKKQTREGNEEEADPRRECCRSRRTREGNAES